MAVTSTGAPVSGTARATAESILLLKSSRVVIAVDAPLSTTCLGRPPSSMTSSGGVGGRWPAVAGMKNGNPGLALALATCTWPLTMRTALGMGAIANVGIGTTAGIGVPATISASG